MVAHVVAQIGRMGEMNDEKPKLTNKQQVFISEYLKSFNATASAIAAGYSEKTAYAMGWENLRKPEIKAEIERRLEEVHMGADEALKLMSDIARGDIGDFVNDFGGVDILRAREAGKTRLIKKIKTKTTTINGKDEDKEIVQEEIELYDSQTALRDILKIHGKFKDDVNLKLPDGLTIKVIKASEATE